MRLTSFVHQEEVTRTLWSEMFRGRKDTHAPRKWYYSKSLYYVHRSFTAIFHV